MAMLLFLQLFSFSLLLSLPLQNAFSTKNLDNLHASKALSSPKNELPYDAKLPNNLPGVQVSAMKLTSGVQNYKEESNEESSVVHLQSWKKSKKSRSRSKKRKNKIKNKKKGKKMKKNLEAGLITAFCLIVLCIVLILLCLLVVKERKKKLQEKALESEKNNEALKIKHNAGTV
jgi:hypothetical protein